MPFSGDGHLQLRGIVAGSEVVLELALNQPRMRHRLDHLLGRRLV